MKPNLPRSIALLVLALLLVAAAPRHANAQFGVPSLFITWSNFTNLGTGYSVQLTIANTGQGDADTLVLDTAACNFIEPTSPTVPYSVGNVDAGRSVTITLTYPNSVGVPGQTVPIGAGGTYSSPTGRGYFSVNSSAVLPARVTVSSVTLSPTIVTKGASSVGTVTLSAAAPAGGAAVSLKSNRAATSVPATVTVSAGTTSASFTATTQNVSTTTTATITASYANTSQSAVLTIQGSVILPTLSSVTVSPSTFKGAQTGTGTVTLNNAAPTGGATIALSSNSPAATVPGSVTIAAGATSASFSISTLPVAAKTSVTISGSYQGVTRQTVITIVPPTLTSLSLAPTSLKGGLASTATLTLDSVAPSGGTVISIASSNAAVAAVPNAVTVNPGATTATVMVSTSPVAADTNVTISAANAGVVKQATLTVQAPALAAVTLNPASVEGSKASNGTVLLDGPAPSGGAVIALSSSNGVARPPANVTVASGATTASFAVNTIAVAATTTSTITGAYHGASRQAVLTVLPPAISTLTLSRTQVRGGTSIVGTVSIDIPAPASLTVSLSSSNATAASSPSSVVIAPNATSATFTINTYQISATAKVTISAAFAGGTRQAVLTVYPPNVKYIISDLGTLGGANSFSNAINALGHITGYADTTGADPSGNPSYHAFLSSNGVTQDVTPFNPFSSNGCAINDKGEVAGLLSANNWTEMHAFVSLPTAAYGLPAGVNDLSGYLTPLGGHNSIAFGMNSTGEIVGLLETDDGHSHAFIFNNGAVQFLLPDDNGFSNAVSINASGEVAGTFGTGIVDLRGNSIFHAFLKAPGQQMMDLGILPGYEYSEASQVNAIGQVAGNVLFADGNPIAFFYSNNQMKTLGVLSGAMYSYAYGLDDEGNVVGYSFSDGNNPLDGHAFLYSGGQMQDLNGMIDSTAGWTLLRAEGINITGQITGWGAIGGNKHAYLLTPLQ